MHFCCVIFVIIVIIVIIIIVIIIIIIITIIIVMGNVLCRLLIRFYSNLILYSVELFGLFSSLNCRKFNPSGAEDVLCLMVPDTLALCICHQQPWYWRLWMINDSLSFVRGVPNTCTVSALRIDRKRTHIACFRKHSWNDWRLTSE